MPTVTRDQVSEPVPEEQEELSYGQRLAMELDSQEEEDEVTPQVEEKEVEVKEDGKQEENKEEAKTGEEAGDTGDREEEKVDPRDSEIAELRAMVRDARKEIALLRARGETDRKTLDAIKQAKPGADLLDEDESKVPEVEPSDLEKLQGEIADIGARRGESLRSLLATMEVNPKYEDVRDVCSRSNFNDMVEAIATQYAKDEGLDMAVAILAVEKSIWQLDNPYKFLYENIKEHHPRYAVKREPPKEKEPPKAPTSIMSVGTGDAGEKSGWTSARIDALMDQYEAGQVSYTEVKKIPSDVYDRYLAGQLP